MNATDPDSPNLTYDFEVYAGGTLVAKVNGVSGDSSGITSATLTAALTDNTVYQWRTRAYDGNLYGPWTATASFTVHLPQTGITATIDFDPDTLNKSSNGTWVVVYIELPAGYNIKTSTSLRSASQGPSLRRRGLTRSATRTRTVSPT